MKKFTLMALVTAVMGAAIVGCTPEAREQYSEAGQKASEATKQTGEAVKTDAAATGEAIKDKTQEAARAAENTTMTGRVRAAIDEAKDLTIKDLDVDTVGIDAGNRRVILKGKADNENAKKRAEELAKNVAGSDYIVENQIVIGQ